MKVYALHALKIAGEDYEPGDALDLPRNTDREKADFDRLVREGVVTTKPREAEAETTPDDDESSSGRTGRNRRS